MALGALRDEEIGGGIVRRIFRRNGEPVLAGTVLSREEIMSMEINNRRCLVRLGMIDIFPPPPPIKMEEGESAHIIQVGKGRFNVIIGRKINDEPITHEQALALVSTKN